MVTNTTLDRVCPSQGSHNNVELENPARFFVDEHNKKETRWSSSRVVKASKQVVAGTLHHLTVEAINPERCPYTVSCVHKRSCSSWCYNHAVKTIQQRSNSLLPYELIEFVYANAEVSKDFAKLNMLLKLKRGDNEDKKKE
ncbi:Cysteine proteinase inhibitor 1 [Hibiscus syriacus]|uniref:Cysteine proteinase inhibitor n=1 Tax=Hibiscus syriacus TaxID=106335 RepID=A0A6A2XJM4_HIBSY|nr:cysteine proteinase inhibitor 12-like [Hibiscus syriacus]KAE8662216.1 Cysteine proteinase inhibitor 1 [Hibiscus syriacus]